MILEFSTIEKFFAKCDRFREDHPGRLEPLVTLLVPLQQIPVRIAILGGDFARCQDVPSFGSLEECPSSIAPSLFFWFFSLNTNGTFLDYINLASFQVLRVYLEDQLFNSINPLPPFHLLN